jgi:hypothetical protein
MTAEPQMAAAFMRVCPWVDITNNPNTRQFSLSYDWQGWHGYGGLIGARAAGRWTAVLYDQAGKAIFSLSEHLQSDIARQVCHYLYKPRLYIEPSRDSDDVARYLTGRFQSWIWEPWEGCPASMILTDTPDAQYRLRGSVLYSREGAPLVFFRKKRGMGLAKEVCHYFKGEKQP